jgi:hypothetical protein
MNYLPPGSLVESLEPARGLRVSFPSIRPRSRRCERRSPLLQPASAGSGNRSLFIVIIESVLSTSEPIPADAGILSGEEEKSEQDK